MAPYGGFDHNAQTLRTLSKLESPYPLWPGLNLSWELMEGLAKHNGPVLSPNWALREIDTEFPLGLQQFASLEAQIAAISDDIAYDNHDIDDGVRAGLLTLDQLLDLPFVERRWRAICVRYPGARHETLLRELIREQIGVMVNDVIETTKARISAAGIEIADDVRDAGRTIGGFSDELAERERTLKSFMYANLYHHPTQLAAAEGAAKTVSDLFNAYSSDTRLLPQEWRDSLPVEQPARARHVGDFLAGMTDRFAMNSHREIFGGQMEGLVK